MPLSIKVFAELFSKSDSILLACLFDSNCNGNSHTNHRVVTCADETHHLYVKVPAALFGVTKKPVFSTKNTMYYMSKLHHVDVFLDTL